MSGDYAVVDPDDVPETPFPESEILHKQFTEIVGCSEMRVNTVTLHPGEETTPHFHTRQEEIYVAFDGGHVRLDDEVHAVATRGVVRIGPDPVRSLRNESDSEVQRWIMVGAPPHGTIEDFGEYELPDK